MRDNLEELNDRGPVRHPGAARRRRPHPHLRRARPARGLRGPALLRQGRLRGPARHGPARRDQARPGDGRPRLGPRARRSRDRAGPAPASSERDDGGRRPARPLARGRDRQPGLRAAVPRQPGRQGHRRSTTSPPTSTRRRCSATSGGSGPRSGETDDEFKDRIRADAARRSWPRPRPTACCVPAGRLRLLRRPTATATTSSSGRTRPARPSGCASRSPASRRARGSASPTSSGRSSRARSTTPPSTSSRWAQRCRERDRRAVRRRTATRTTCSCTASASRWPRRWPSYWHRRIREEWGFADEDGPIARPACSASSTAAAATRGATRPAPTSRTTPRCAELLDADRIGVEVSEETGFQFQPEQTTARHHLPPPQGQVLRREVARRDRTLRCVSVGGCSATGCGHAVGGSRGQSLSRAFVAKADSSASPAVSGL